MEFVEAWVEAFLVGEEEDLELNNLSLLENVEPMCHRYDFLVRLWNGLVFFELFKLNFLGIDHDPPMFSMFT